MKYLLAWSPRAGSSAAEFEEAEKDALQVLGKWAPPDGADFREFLTRVDGEGGYAVVETDDVNALMDGPVKFAPYFQFSVIPVVDLAEAVATFAAAVAWRESARD